METTTTTWGQIQGREISFPMEVAEMNAATLLFSVPIEAAERLLPGNRFELAEVAPGTAQLIIAACDYRRNPWGDYNELNFGFLARPVGALDDVIGSFVYRMPVNQQFTCEAGNQVMGFPKTVEALDADYTDGTVSFRLAMDGHLTIALTVPRVDPLGAPERIDVDSYSYLDGIAYSTPLSMDMGTGVIDPEAVTIVLGDGPLADELRSLGLPRAPDLATWGEGLSATFRLGHPV